MLAERLTTTISFRELVNGFRELVTVRRGARLNERQWQRLMDSLVEIQQGVDSLLPYEFSKKVKHDQSDLEYALQDSILRILERRLTPPDLLTGKTATAAAEVLVGELTGISDTDLMEQAQRCHKKILSDFSNNAIYETIKHCRSEAGCKKLQQLFNFRTQGPGGDVAWASADVSSQVQEIMDKTRP